MHLGVLAYLAHVSSHAGVIGNERADTLAKEGTFKKNATTFAKI